MEYVLQTKNLTKMFGKKKAVNEVNINVKKGDIYGFIGRNGAGKTTFIRVVSGLAKKSEGQIQLFESDDLSTQRRKTGTMIENPAVYPNLTAEQNLEYYCLLLGLDPKKTVNEILQFVGLQNTGKKKAKNFSLGMKQRLAIGISLLDDPEFLMLDEPINGLDPTGIREVRELLLKLNREKSITILISSHILGELSRLANRYGVINNGILVDEFTSSELQERCSGVLEIQVDHIEKAAQVIKDVIGISDFSIMNDTTIHIRQGLDQAGKINMELAKHEITVNSSSIVGRDLESYFMQLMGAM